MTSTPETYRAVLTPDEVTIALGHFVLFLRGGPSQGSASTNCMFVLDETQKPPQLRQVRVEVTVSEKPE
jgi:hypothetical protein